MKKYQKLFEEELNKHINLEKSRRFDLIKLKERQVLLEQVILKDELKLQGNRISVIGSNGKGSTAFYLSLLPQISKNYLAGLSPQVSLSQHVGQNVGVPTLHESGKAGLVGQNVGVPTLHESGKAGLVGQNVGVPTLHESGKAWLVEQNVGVPTLHKSGQILEQTQRQELVSGRKSEQAEIAKIGLYTSPHLSNILERIRIRNLSENKTVIPYINSQFAWESLLELSSILKENFALLTYFEILTLLALYIFNKKNCFIQIYEAGLGGRWDATKVISAQTVVLTLIEKEHTSILGDTYEKILFEKLGILNNFTKYLFCFEDNKNISKELIESTAKKFSPNIKIFFYRTEILKNKCYLYANENFAKFIIEKLINLELNNNENLFENNLDKINLLEDSNTEQIKDKISDFENFSNIKIQINYNPNIQINLPGRLENFLKVIKIKKNDFFNCEFIFDTAHNPPAIDIALTDIIYSKYKNEISNNSNKNLIFVAQLEDRNLQEVLEVLIKNNIIYILILQGTGWAKIENIEKNFETKLNKEINTYFTSFNNSYKKIINLIKKEKFDKIIFLGSHRIYSIFEKFKN